MQANITRRQCKCCLKPLYQEVSLYHLVKEPVLCVSCLQQWEVLDSKSLWNAYPIWILYRYNSFFKQLLYQYKGLYDIALHDVFLSIFYQEWQQKYKNHIFVIAPSNPEDNEKRGFIPNQEILKGISSNIFTGVYKQTAYKQTRQKDRTQIHQVIAITKGEQLRGKKVVIFDDVITSGNTILAILSVILPYQPKSIEIIVLATT